MNRNGAESGGVLLTALLVGLLLAMIGGVAMNLAMTETAESGGHWEETASRLLAESGVEQVVAWLTHNELPGPLGTARIEDVMVPSGPSSIASAERQRLPTWTSTRAGRRMTVSSMTRARAHFAVSLTSAALRVFDCTDLSVRKASARSR